MTLNEAIAALKRGETTLDLYHTDLGDAGATALATELETNRTVMGLELSANNIRPTGAIAFATALKINETLQILYLNVNPIRSAGATAFATALETNNTLRTLGLRHCDIGDSGAAAFATALKINTTLKVLDLQYNPIRNAGLLALATALETNTTLTTLDLPFLDLGTTTYKARVRIQALLKRNQQLLELRPLLEVVRKQLAVDVTYEGADPNPIPEYLARGEIKQPYFNVTQLFATLADLHQEIKGLATPESPLRLKGIRKLHNHWLALVVLFHLRCVDTPNDTSPIDNIHPQVAAAERCLAQMDVDSEGYKEACYQLGRYYFQRAAKCFDAKDHDQGKAFAKTALNYLHVCKQDPNFKEADTQGLIYNDSELPELISYLVTSMLLSPDEFSVTDVVKETKESVQSKQTIKDYKIHMPNQEDYDRARNLEVPGAKTVPAQINYDEAEILASLKNTANAAEKTAAFYRQLKQTEKADPAVALDSVLKLLDQELANANQLATQPPSLLSNVSDFFKMRANSLSPQQIAILQARAIQAIRNALTGKRVEGNFADHIILLKNTAVIDKLNLFIAAGHAKVGDKKVETLEEFVTEVMKANIPAPGKK